MIIIVSGLTGSGKTTLAKRLAEYFKFEYVSGSSLLRKALPLRFDVWESKEGLSAIALRMKELKYDKKIDNYIKKYVSRKSDLVLDSWTAAYYIRRKNTIKIRLQANEKERAKRISIRDKIGYKNALKRIHEKDVETAKIYMKLYGFDVINDLSKFDLILSTDKIGENATFDICRRFIEADNRK